MCLVNGPFLPIRTLKGLPETQCSGGSIIKVRGVFESVIITLPLASVCRGLTDTKTTPRVRDQGNLARPMETL